MRQDKYNGATKTGGPSREQLGAEAKGLLKTTEILFRNWRIYGGGQPSRISLWIPLSNYWGVRHAAANFIRFAESHLLATALVHPSANACGGIILLQVAEVEPNHFYRQSYQDVGKQQLHIALPKYSRRFQRDLSIPDSQDIPSAITQLVDLLYGRMSPGEADLGPFMLTTHV